MVFFVTSVWSGVSCGMLTDKEKFIYFATAITKDDKLMKLPHDKRTMLLAAIRNEHCKTLTNKEWCEVFADVEQLRHKVGVGAFVDLLNGYGKDKIANMFADFITKGYVHFDDNKPQNNF